jgi:hypothetical protein
MTDFLSNSVTLLRHPSAPSPFSVTLLLRHPSAPSPFCSVTLLRLSPWRPIPERRSHQPYDRLPLKLRHPSPSPSSNSNGGLLLHHNRTIRHTIKYSLFQISTFKYVWIEHSHFHLQVGKYTYTTFCFVFDNLHVITNAM